MIPMNTLGTFVGSSHLRVLSLSFCGLLYKVQAGRQLGHSGIEEARYHGQLHRTLNVTG